MSSLLWSSGSWDHDWAWGLGTQIEISSSGSSSSNSDDAFRSVAAGGGDSGADSLSARVGARLAPPAESDPLQPLLVLAARAAVDAPGVLPRVGSAGGLFARSLAGKGARRTGSSHGRLVLGRRGRMSLLRAASRRRTLDGMLLQWIFTGDPGAEDRALISGPGAAANEPITISLDSDEPILDQVEGGVSNGHGATADDEDMPLSQQMVPHGGGTGGGWGLAELSLAGVADLSAESLLEKILRHGGSSLRALDLADVTQLTSNMLRQITADCPNLQSLSLVNCGQLTSVSLDGLPRLRALQTLRLGGLFDVTSEGTQYIVRCRALRHLDLSYCHMLSADAVRALTGEQQLLPGSGGLHLDQPQQGGIAKALHRVDFGYVPLPLESVMNSLPRFISLRGLSLARNEEVMDIVVERIAASCPHLRRIDLSHCTHVSDAAVGHLVNFCPLEAISLESCNITDEALRHLARCSASPSGRDGRGEHQLPGAIDLTDGSGSPQQAQVQAQQTTTAGDIPPAGNAISSRDQLPTLKILSTADCPGVTDAGAQHLFDHGNQPIADLCFSACSISSAALVSLAASSVAKTVRRLDVSFCREVGEAGLSDVLRVAPQLTHVLAWGQSWPPENLEQIKSQSIAPSLHVEVALIAPRV